MSADNSMRATGFDKPLYTFISTCRRGGVSFVIFLGQFNDVGRKKWTAISQRNSIYKM